MRTVEISDDFAAYLATQMRPGEDHSGVIVRLLGVDQQGPEQKMAPAFREYLNGQLLHGENCYDAFSRLCGLEKCPRQYPYHGHGAPHLRAVAESLAKEAGVRVVCYCKRRLP